MSSLNSSIKRAITGMSSGPEEEDSFDVDRAAQSHHGGELIGNDR